MIRGMNTNPKRSRGRQFKLNDEHRKLLKELQEADPAATLVQLAKRLEQRCGVVVGGMTVSRELARMGVRHVALPRTLPQPTATPTKPYAIEAAAAPPDTADRRAYPTDLTDAEWAILEPMIPRTLPGGRPEEWSRRELVNAMFYVLKNGCTWRSLPHDFPPWSTVYSYFRKWRISGLWQQINDAIRPRVRQKAGRSATPSAGIMDSQSARTTEKGGPVDTTEPRD